MKKLSILTMMFLLAICSFSDNTKQISTKVTDNYCTEWYASGNEEVMVFRYYHKCVIEGDTYTGNIAVGYVYTKKKIAPDKYHTTSDYIKTLLKELPSYAITKFNSHKFNSKDNAYAIYEGREQKRPVMKNNNSEMEDMYLDYSIYVYIQDDNYNTIRPTTDIIK